MGGSKKAGRGSERENERSLLKLGLDNKCMFLLCFFIACF